jgi:hypothetical protein
MIELEFAELESSYNDTTVPGFISSGAPFILPAAAHNFFTR